MKVDFSVRCSPSENYCIKESYFVISYFGRGLNFFGWGLLVSLIKIWIFSVTFPKKGNVINETFSLVSLCWIRFVQEFVSVSAL